MKALAILVMVGILALSSVALAEDVAVIAAPVEATVTTTPVATTAVTAKSYISAAPAKSLIMPKVTRVKPITLGPYKDVHGCGAKEIWCDILQKCINPSLEKCATPLRARVGWNKGEAPSPVRVKEVAGLAKLDKPLENKYAIHYRVREDRPNPYLTAKRDLNKLAVPIQKSK